MANISDRLSQVLDNKGVTPYKLSKHTGISQSTIHRILKQGQDPNRSTLKAIADYLEVSDYWLSTGKEKNKPFQTQVYKLPENSDKNEGKSIDLEDVSVSELAKIIVLNFEKLQHNVTFRLLIEREVNKVLADKYREDYEKMILNKPAKK